jgi:5'-3' exonuclease
MPPPAAVPDPNRRLLLLDTPSLYFRAFYGIPETVTAPDGTPVNAIRGLLDFVSFLVERYRPGRLVSCMDADWRPAFRVDLIPSYKAHRVAPAGGETVPDALTPQVAVIEQVLDAIGICQLGVAGFEADDVIATLAVREPGAVDIVTGDRDLFQLVDDAKPIRIVYTARGVGKADVIDESAVSARYGIPGRSYADFAALRGDPSDGLPGVAGIGDKTAAALVSRFGSLAQLVAALHTDTDAGFPAGTRTKLKNSLDYLEAARVVVATRTDVPVGSLDDDLPRRIRDEAGLLALITRYGLASPVQRLATALKLTVGVGSPATTRVAHQPTDE